MKINYACSFAWIDDFDYMHACMSANCSAGSLWFNELYLIDAKPNWARTPRMRSDAIEHKRSWKFAHFSRSIGNAIGKQSPSIVTAQIIYRYLFSPFFVRSLPVWSHGQFITAQYVECVAFVSGVWFRFTFANNTWPTFMVLCRLCALSRCHGHFWCDWVMQGTMVAAWHDTRTETPAPDPVHYGAPCTL